MRTRSLMVPLVLGLTAALGAQTVETMPNPLPATMSGNYFPWGNSPAHANAQHVQFIYDGSHISASYPILIQRLRFHSTGACPGGTATMVTIKLSQCPLAWNAITTNYAGNLTPAKTVTVVSSATVKTVTTTGPGWAYDLKLTTPYLFDPTKGALVFDWERDPAGVITGGFIGGMCGTPTNPLMGSRTYGPANTPLAAGLTMPAAGYAAGCEITWIPAKGLYSSFSAKPREGKSPLKVQFTDTSYTSAGPITSWAWDLNGDSKIDSTVQNPTFVYAGKGWDVWFNVTLTVTDATHKPSTFTAKKFIRVNPSTATATDYGTGSTNKPAPSPIGMPDYTYTYSAAAGVRGYFFVAPSTFIVNGFEAPNDFVPPETDQTITCIVVPTPPTAAFTPTAAQVRFHATGKANTILRPTKPIIVQKGEWFGILGACHAPTAASPLRNSYGAGEYWTSVNSQKIQVKRLWMNFDPRTNKGIGLMNPSSGAIGRVFVHVIGNTSVPSLTTLTTTMPVLGGTPTLDYNAHFSGAIGTMIIMGAGRLPAVKTPFGNLLVRPPFYLTAFAASAKGTFPVPIPNDANLTGLVINWQSVHFNPKDALNGTSNGTEWFLGL